jgi:50S ribosomal subunit-associated GTPase HflX
MKIRYKIQYVILAILVICTFIGLFNVLQVKNVGIEDIKQCIEQTTDVSAMQYDDNGAKLKKLYGINKRDLDDFALYAPKSNMEANEILILKAKTKDDIKTLQAKINDRVQKQSDSFKNYEQTQYGIISNYVLEQKEQYLILIISKDSKSIKEAIDKKF